MVDIRHPGRTDQCRQWDGSANSFNISSTPTFSLLDVPAPSSGWTLQAAAGRVRTSAADSGTFPTLHHLDLHHDFLQHATGLLVRWAGSCGGLGHRPWDLMRALVYYCSTAEELLCWRCGTGLWNVHSASQGCRLVATRPHAVLQLADRQAGGSREGIAPPPCPWHTAAGHSPRASGPCAMPGRPPVHRPQDSGPTPS